MITGVSPAASRRNSGIKKHKAGQPAQIGAALIRRHFFMQGPLAGRGKGAPSRKFPVQPSQLAAAHHKSGAFFSGFPAVRFLPVLRHRAVLLRPAGWRQAQEGRRGESRIDETGLSITQPIRFHVRADGGCHVWQASWTMADDLPSLKVSPRDGGRLLRRDGRGIGRNKVCGS